MHMSPKVKHSLNSPSIKSFMRSLSGVEEFVDINFTSTQGFLLEGPCNNPTATPYFFRHANCNFFLQLLISKCSHYIHVHFMFVYISNKKSQKFYDSLAISI